LTKALMAVALAAACAGWPAALAGQSAAPLVLTRRQAIDTALARNPALAAVREEIAQARAREVEATAFPDPAISADVTGESNLAHPGRNTGSDIGVGLDLPFPTKFLLRHRVSHADVASARDAYEQLRQETASQTAQAYDAVLVALRHQADLEQGRQLAQEFLDKARVRYAQGSVARLDVIKAEVDAAQAENALIANGRDLANARAALNRLLGRVLGAAVEPADTLVVPPALPALAQLDSIALGMRPELASLQSQRAGARAATSLAKEYWLPDLGVSVSENFVAGAPTTYTTAVGFSFPLFFWNHQGGEVAEASHHERELDATYRDLEAQVDQDVRTTYATAATALQQAEYLRDQLVPEAREAYNIASTSYGLGGSSVLQVLDARRTLLDAESQYAEALGAANDARADLERAIGMPLDSIPAGGPQ
jgi:cobalt-zinc-cadmium efflux system outer membrane protein